MQPLHSPRDPRRKERRHLALHIGWIQDRPQTWAVLYFCYLAYSFDKIAKRR
jgi:hypothetical protein